MQTSLLRTINHTILVDETFLRSLISFLNTQYTTIDYKLYCADGAFRTPDTLDGILTYDNANHHKIQEVMIKGRTTGDDNFSLEIRARYLLDNAQMYIHGSDEAKINHVKETVLDKLRSARQPMFWELMSRVRPYMLVLGYLAFVFLGVLIYRALNPNAPVRETTAREDINFYTTWFLSLIIVGILELTQSYLYPRIFILLGRQSRTYGNIKGGQVIVFGTIVLGAIVSFIVNKIS